MDASRWRSLWPRPAAPAHRCSRRNRRRRQQASMKSSSPPASARKSCRRHRSRSPRSRPTNCSRAACRTPSKSPTRCRTPSLRPAQAAFGASMTAYIRGIGQYDFLPEFEPGVGDLLRRRAAPGDLRVQRRSHGPGARRSAARSAGHAVRPRFDRRRHPLHQQDAAGRRHRQHLRHLRRLQPHRHPRQLRLQALRDRCSHASAASRRNATATRRFTTSRAETRCSRATATAWRPTVPMSIRRRTWWRGSAADNAFAIPRRTQNRGASCKVGTQGGQDVTGARAALRFAPSDTSI